MAALSAGCADDAPRDSETLGGRDSGSHERDGGSATDDPSDAGGDGEVLDPDAGLLSECDGDVLSFPAARAAGPSFNASAIDNRLELVYLEPACGGTRGNNNAQGLARISLQTVGAPSAPQALVNLDVASCYSTRDPSVLAQADGKYAVFFTSNSDGAGYELHFLDGAQSTRMSRDTMHSEFGVVARVIGNQPLVAFSRDQVDPLPDFAAADIVTARPGAAATVVVPESAGFHANHLSLAALSPMAPANFAGALAWTSNEPDHMGAFLQLITAQGSATGTVQTLTHDPSDAVSLATGTQGGAVAYIVGSAGSQQVRFRVLNADGSLGEEVVLTAGNQSVREVALGHYSSGYVLAYRKLAVGHEQDDSIRLMFLDPKGRLGRSRFVAATPSGGVGVEVHVANDGRLWVLWEEGVLSEPLDDAGSSEVEGRIKVARLECP